MESVQLGHSGAKRQLENSIDEGDYGKRARHRFGGRVDQRDAGDKHLQSAHQDHTDSSSDTHGKSRGRAEGISRLDDAGGGWGGSKVKCETESDSMHEDADDD